METFSEANIKCIQYPLAKESKNYSRIAQTLTSLGITYSALGNSQKQRALLERALKINVMCYGGMHPQVGITLYNLAETFWKLEKIVSGMSYAKRAYEIFLQPQQCGPNHPWTKAAKEQVEAFSLAMQQELKKAVSNEISSSISEASLKEEENNNSASFVLEEKKTSDQLLSERVIKFSTFSPAASFFKLATQPSDKSIKPTKKEVNNDMESGSLHFYEKLD